MTTEDLTPERAEDQKRSEKPEMATGDLPPLEAYNAAALAICRYDRHAGLGFSMRDAPNGRQVGEAASAVNAVWNLAYQAGREDAARAERAKGTTHSNLVWIVDTEAAHDQPFGVFTDEQAAKDAAAKTPGTSWSSVFLNRIYT